MAGSRHRPMEMSRDRLRTALLARCRQEKIEPPAPGRTERLLGAAEAMFERQFTQTTVGRLSTESIGKLEELIPPMPRGGRRARTTPDLSRARGKGPGPGAPGAGGRSWQELKEDPGLAGWRARVMKMYPSDLADAPDPIRITLLAALALAGREDPAVTAALLERLRDHEPPVARRCGGGAGKDGTQPRPHDLGRDNPAP